MEDGSPAHPPEQLAERAPEPTLILGEAGSGRTELLVRRFAALADAGVPVECIAVLSGGAAGRAALRERIAARAGGSFDEAWIETWPGFAERLLRDYALEAGVDPFFQVASPADRLALLLDNLDALPLRRHEIRGNPTGLLARLLERMDVLRAEGIGPAELRDRARAAERGAAGRAERDAALREVELSEIYDRHDAILLGLGLLDEHELVLELGRLLSRHAGVRAAIAARFEWLLVDDLEDAGRPRIACLPMLAPRGNVIATCDPEQATDAYRGYGEAAALGFLEALPGARVVNLPPGRRGGTELARARAALRALVPGSYRRLAGSLAPVKPGSPGDGTNDGEAARDLVAEPGAGRRGASRSSAGSPVRFWRCANERAEAQAVAREIEHLLAEGELRPAEVCVVATAPAGGRLVAAALEERGVRYRSAGSAEFFGRPEVRDAIAWLRALADPDDSSAVVRALTQPPVQLPSVDLARCTTIARRRKLDMVSALEAALDSPQLPPPSRDRVRSFLKLYRAAAGAIDRLRADVFVRRLIERVGFRRHGLFAASPQTAERLVNLSRLAELAASWSRRRPDGSTRDFVRYLAAVGEAGRRLDHHDEPPPRDAVLLASPDQLKGMEFERVYLIGLGEGALRQGAERGGWIPDELLGAELPPAADVAAALAARRAQLALGRSRGRAVLAYPERVRDAAAAPAPAYVAVRDALGGLEEVHEEELFGPAEGLHATYRMIRDEVLESSWRAGAALSEMRLDTPEDVNRAVARFLELLKLSALIQRPGEESERDAIEALNELLGRIATPEQLAELQRSALDEYVLDEGRDRARRGERLAAAGEPGLEAFLPKRGEGLALSASDVGLYLTCPLKYKFARVFAIPQEPTINQRFGILVHNVLERFHAEEIRAAGESAGTASAGEGGLERLLGLFEAGWRRTGFGFSDDELQYRDRAVAALARYHERHCAGAARPVWLERRFSFRIGADTIAGRVDRVDRHPDGSYELIDYKTGPAKRPVELGDDVQIALYRVAAREAWDIEAADGSYWYVLEDKKVPAGGEPDALERVERTVAEVAAGINEQDFEPRPSFAVCSWCDYRLICPASEA